MDAWESLFGNSVLELGDAWEHLQNQQGGGTGETVFLLGPVEAELGSYEISAEVIDILSCNVIDELLSVEIKELFSVNVNLEILEVEI